MGQRESYVSLSRYDKDVRACERVENDHGIHSWWGRPEKMESMSRKLSH